MRSKALLIDAKARNITVVEIENTDDMRKFVGGDIALGHYWPNGDVLYVDDSGLLKYPEHFFTVTGSAGTPLAGFGLIVGPELVDFESDKFLGNKDVQHTIEETTPLVTYQSRDELVAWATTNAARPWSSVSSMGKDGRVQMTVIQTIGEFFAEALNAPEIIGRPSNVR